jgi:hypothetical protein
MADAASCRHAEVWRGLCALCGQPVDLPSDHHSDSAFASGEAGSHIPMVGNGIEALGLQIHREVRARTHGPASLPLPSIPSFPPPLSLGCCAAKRLTPHSPLLGAQHAASLARADTERLLKERRLILILDLDKTLIHTTGACGGRTCSAARVGVQPGGKVKRSGAAS